MKEYDYQAIRAHLQELNPEEVVKFANDFVTDELGEIEAEFLSGLTHAPLPSRSIHQ